MSSQDEKKEEPKLGNPAQEQDESIAASKGEAEPEVAVIVDEDEEEPKIVDDDDDDDDDEPKVIIDDEGERPYVKAYVTRPSFRVGDRVYLLRSGRVREGPYLVAAIPGPGRATLCFENGAPVENASAFESITAQAQAGDFVYVHYSGHGTREPPRQEFSNESTGDLVLVLLEGDNGHQESYMWGSELAFFLKDMVDKGLVVTLVLDCCFSGSVYRQDSDVRFAQFKPEVAARHPRNPEKSLSIPSSTHATRDVSMMPNWLINPDGYAIISACGPHEVAKELTLEQGGKREKFGALSYFLRLTLLECGGVSSKHQHIYSLLRAKFRKSWPRQNPVLYGNKHRGFFDQYNSKLAAAEIPLLEKNGVLRIPLGEAHGVCIGDTFSLQSLGVQNMPSADTGLSAAVIATGPLSSEVKCQDRDVKLVKRNLFAKILTRECLKNFPIQLEANLQRQEEWMAELTKRQLDVQTEMSSRFASFQVMLSQDKQYEIRDASTGAQIANLPPLMEEEADVSYVCDILEHLARFRLIQDLKNQTPTYLLPESLDAHIRTANGTFGPDRVIDLNDNTIAHLVIQNKSNKPLYAFAFNLGPHWQVENIYRGPYEVIPPQNLDMVFTGTAKRKLRMTVPSDLRESGSCEDIIKIILTTHPTTFDLFELPELGQSVKSKTVRSGDRQDAVHAPEDWIAFNFRIQTSIK
ncbi:hypothetical protein DL765_006542 [Monosporascus sp. GIB2]|nr:hypothetical protein DL765_006542 [Monosporascus sp. GIB2]